MRETKNLRREHQLRLYVSYAASDSELARKIGRLLSDRTGARVFLWESLSAGQDWQPRMREELAEADAVVVLVTPKAVHSSWVLHEVGAAWGLKKPVIALASGRRVLDRLPLSLEKVWVVDMKELDAPNAAADLFEELDELLAGARPA